jgi:hypothetical protein
VAALEVPVGDLARNYDHLSDDQLEALLISTRTRVLDALEAEGIGFPSDWHSMRQTQQDNWVSAQAREFA